MSQYILQWSSYVIVYYEGTQLSSTHQGLRISRILFERNCEAIGDVQAEVGHLDSMSF